MARKTIGDLTATTSVADADLMELQTAAGPASRRLTMANLWAYLQAKVQALAIGDTQLPERLRPTARIITNWNDATANGFYMAQGATNAPETVKWFLGYTANHGATGYCVQDVFAFTEMTATDHKHWRRYQAAGVWSAWSRVYGTTSEIQSVVTAMSIGGGMALLATRTASSSASLTFTEFNNALYGAYLFDLENILPATDGATLYMRTSTNGGASYDAGATDYIHSGQAQFSAGTNLFGSSGAPQLQLTGDTIGNAAGETGVSGDVKLYGAGVASYAKVRAHLNYRRALDGLVASLTMTGQRLAAADVDAVQFIMSSGSVTSGNIRMYGLKK